MHLSPAGIKELLASPIGKKLVRYSLVSVVGVAVTQVMIVVIHVGFHVSSVATNILAVGLSAIPAYYLNRAWVWGKRGKSHLTKEVIPFWAFAFAGLVLSTIIVGLMAGNHPAGYHDTAWDTAKIMIGNIAGFGLLWVARFLVLDRLLFGAKQHTPFSEELEAEIEFIEREG